MSVDDSLATDVQLHLITFLVGAFQSLDTGIVRKECAPLVSISIWHNLASEQSRERKFEEHTQLRKAWRAASKRYDLADDVVRKQLQFQQRWLCSLLMKLVKHLYSSEAPSSG
jgi:intron-binding protein aquarius